MKSYKAYNLCIASELQLPELMETEGEADAIVRFGKVDSATAIQHNSGQNFVGEIPEVGEFLIYQGREIIINPIAGVDEALLRSVLLGPVLCVLLRQRGLLVLHASCIDINNKGVAFMGGSGWGKSTLATAFHTQGYAVLTDDVLPIQIRTGEAVVFPSYPQFKLWPEAATSLGQDTKSLLPVSQNSFKVAYKLSRGFQQTPLPLQQIYVLDKGSEHKITRMKSQEAFIELVRHTRAISSITEQAFIADHLHLCTELVKNVSFCRFTRKPSLGDLPELVKLIEDDLAEFC
ncbi:hypothetical protein [Brasilonema sp. UFV-L1]|uniref:hypothetical protein n=1 Tax=Brasilonema sp. UFV-L1 TaxID=2234130 RepID=UPI00145F632B|nr:hypothetical protein [Brasilonema sp. UFV-L1]NMG05973.1 hypothetical protein [Brasilonema sp. UFV-L1]